MTLVHVSFRRIDAKIIDRQDCPTCGKPRFFVCLFQHWYGWDVTCLKCGDQWSEEGMYPRPFRPRWRQDNIDSAKCAWRRNDAPATPDMTGPHAPFGPDRGTP